jgi:nitrate/TMAO reductase-like tetraheme cytochrome c subunit
LGTQSGLPLPRPGAQLRGGLDAVRLNEQCEACHSEEAREWRGSMHQRAYQDPIFQAALELEPLPFCRGCHAPEAPAENTDSEVSLRTQQQRELGVGCVTCHVQVGHIVGPRSLDGRYHSTLGDARLTTEAACAGCHEFDFPKPQRALMQSTRSEHEESPLAQESCQDCHMPAVNGGSSEQPKQRKSHRFEVDDRLLESALSVSAERSSDRAVNVTLTVTGAGHAVPTGDLFRRLEVRAHSSAGAVASAVGLERRFEMVPSETGSERRQTADERLAADGTPRTVWLPFGADVHKDTIHIEVVYQRMSEGLATRLGVTHAANEQLIAEVLLPPIRTLETP